MSKYIIGLALVLGVALAAGYAWAADDEDAKKARKDILDVAKEIEAGKDVTAKVDAIRKKHDDMEHLMSIYKRRDKGGLGIGPKGPGDSIDFKIMNLGKRKLPAATLSKEKADLIKMAYLNIAMAKITHKFAGKKKPKEWKEYSETMEKESKNLLDAIKKGDADGIKSTATKLYGTCTGCHSDIRDN